MHGKEHPQAAGVPNGLQQAMDQRRQNPKAFQVAHMSWFGIENKKAFPAVLKSELQQFGHASLGHI